MHTPNSRNTGVNEKSIDSAMQILFVKNCCAHFNIIICRTKHKHVSTLKYYGTLCVCTSHSSTLTTPMSYLYQNAWTLWWREGHVVHETRNMPVKRPIRILLAFLNIYIKKVQIQNSKRIPKFSLIFRACYTHFSMGSTWGPDME